jgi:hypothetical protein
VHVSRHGILKDMVPCILTKVDLHFRGILSPLSGPDDGGSTHL